MTERTIASNGAEICTQSFGYSGNPTVLMIMGATASMLWWPDELCERLAQTGRFVIRYDNRDTGRSTTQAPGAPTYTLDDLADDAISVLDAYEVECAHLVGMSLGGMIAQVVALKHRSRIASITAISSSKFGDDDPELPGMDNQFLEHFATSASLDWSNERAVTNFKVHSWRLCKGADRPFDETRAADLAIREFRRAINAQSMMNHAMLGGGTEWQNKFAEIRAPFLVIHGTDDPILPYPHGMALAKAVHGAQLVTLKGAGHELHPADWNTITSAIADHTS
ncbi:alpha/beta fold hydrolase [Peristeroidobacter soli]|uniref:alpha/beta fold hydrolase n=1 Tax=Peristeroidobacter soli TaxID=2497877 RepID=UPI00101D1386|nr:alpha/beta hydrolase [Peristeroidobacter soli]